MQSRRAAALQALTVVILFHGFLLLSALLGTDASTRLEHPLRSVAMSGGLMLLPVLLFSVRDAKWAASLGLQRTAFLPVLGWGGVGVLGAYAAGALMSSAYLALRGLQGQIAERANWMRQLSTLPWTAILPVVAVAALWEEIVFRGFLLGRVRVALGEGKEAWAVALTAVLFGAGHAYQGGLGVFQTTAIGVVFGALTVWRKSLWPAVVAHLVIDGTSLVAIRLLGPLLGKLAPH